MSTQLRATQIMNGIMALFPDAECELSHRNAFELLIAVMLSAQTTDIAVNKVTPALFERFPTPEAVIQSSPEEIMTYIKTIGLYRNKARYVFQCCEQLIERFGGEVPSTRKELESLSGVGRKTANVVLSVWFKQAAIAVDTHVERVSKRLKLADELATPRQVEERLMSLYPSDQWHQIHHSLIFFGRYHCLARQPKCEACPLLQYCEFGQKKLNQLK